MICQPLLECGLERTWLRFPEADSGILRVTLGRLVVIENPLGSFLGRHAAGIGDGLLAVRGRFDLALHRSFFFGFFHRMFS